MNLNSLTFINTTKKNNSHVGCKIYGLHTWYIEERLKFEIHEGHIGDRKLISAPHDLLNKLWKDRYKLL